MANYGLETLNFLYEKWDYLDLACKLPVLKDSLSANLSFGQLENVENILAKLVTQL